MEQIIVLRANGEKLPLFRSEPYCVVTKAAQQQGLLADDVLQLSVSSVVALPFAIGDRILAFGTEYTLNQLPIAKKRSSRLFDYELTFEGPQYSLLRTIYLDQDKSGFATGSEFTLTADLELFVEVLMTNINRALPGWTLGHVEMNTEYKTLSFSNENCLAVLQRLCKEFQTEFSIVRTGDNARTLSFGPAGQVLGQTFRYGRGQGLYELQRQSVDDKNFFTRLYAFGGSRNLASNYRGYSNRLRMRTQGSYLENPDALAAFGLIEASKNFEDIYPRRTGAVTQATGLLSFIDASMDFDLNETVPGTERIENKKTVADTKYLIAGVAAKVHFNTGNLAGYEFQIAKYEAGPRQFTLIAFQDERGQSFPATGAFEIKEGDSYVLLDIMMPDSYVANAEIELEKAAQEFLDQNSTPRVQYSLEIDEQYLIGRADTGALTNFFTVGDYLQIEDKELEIDKASRVTGLERDLLRPYQYRLTIADTYQVTRIERILAQQKEVDTVIRLNGLNDPAAARVGWRNTQELLNVIFDPDGYFDGGRIKPESIETGMLVVGAKSGQFILNCVIEPNYQGASNVVKVNPGVLTHYTIEDDIRTWQIAGQTITINDSLFRYIYARCSKTDDDDAALLFSSKQIRPNDDANFYHFLIGVLHSVDEKTNVRFISLTYGSTTINGRFITTGRIQSANGLTYFDLDSGEIGGKIKFLSTDKSLKPIETLVQTTIDGGMVTSGSIRLAGVGGQVLAGITGQGADDTSVRIWAGAAYDSRMLAPFRVLQSGEVFARKRIEMVNQANVGQAGICGANTAADGTIRIWAGTDYAGRASAPFRVDASGAVTALAGYIGKWEIENGGIVNSTGDAFIVARNRSDAFRSEARIGTQIFSSATGIKGSALFTTTEQNLTVANYAIYAEAANEARLQREGFGLNYAIYAARGMAMFNEGLLNGRSYYGNALNDINPVIDPGLYDMIDIYPSGSNGVVIHFDMTGPLGVKPQNGKEVIVLNSNPVYDRMFLKDIVRGAENGLFQIKGGDVARIVHANGFWYCTSYWDNYWQPTGSPPNYPKPPTTAQGGIAPYVSPPKPTNPGGSNAVYPLAKTSDFEGTTGGGGGTGTGDGFAPYTNADLQDGQDFNGQRMAISTAPVVVVQRKSKPRMNGGRYTLEPQLALNTFQARRHPEIDLTGVFMWVYSSANFKTEAPYLLSRGAGAVSDSVPFRFNITRSQLSLNIPGNNGQAGQLADDLADPKKGGNPDDPKIPWLRGWADHNYLIDNYDACVAFGRRALADHNNKDWSDGVAILTETPNFEDNYANPNSPNDRFTQYMNMLGWFYEGMRIEAEARNQTPPKLLPYDYSDPTPYYLSLLSKLQDSSGSYDHNGTIVTLDAEPGEPGWMSYKFTTAQFGGGTKLAPLSSNSPYTTQTRLNGSVGSQEYNGQTYPDGVSHWKLDANGKRLTTIIKDVTVLIYADTPFHTTIMGEECDILGRNGFFYGESYHYVYTNYERFGQMMGTLKRLSGGKRLPKSTDRQAGWEATGRHIWSRTDAEFKQPYQVQDANGEIIVNPHTKEKYDLKALNERPLPASFFENDKMLSYFMGIPLYRDWAGHQAEIEGQGVNLDGTNYAGTGNHAYGGMEFSQKAANRISQFKWLKDQVTQYILPICPIFEHAPDRDWHNPNYDFCKIPRAVGRLCAGRTDLEGSPAYFAFYCDFIGEDIDVYQPSYYWWVDASGQPVTGSYQANLGKIGWADDHEVPAIVGTLPPEQFRWKYTDLTGVDRVRMGDWLYGDVTINTTVPPLA